MPLIAPDIPPVNPRSAQPLRLRLLVAYQDLSAAHHARATCDFLAQQLRRDFALECRYWSFSVLRNPRLQARATRDAGEADLIIVSSHPAAAPPAEFFTWVDSWAHRACHALATVSLMDPPIATASQGSVVRRHLEMVARQLGIPFFAQPDRWPESPVPAIPTGSDASGTLPPLPPEIILRPQGNCAHWGINE